MEYRNGEYYLSDTESELLFKQAICPDPDVLNRRDEFFADIDATIQIQDMGNGNVIIDIPYLEIPFELSGSFSYVLSDRDSDYVMEPTYHLGDAA